MWHSPPLITRAPLSRVDVVFVHAIFCTLGSTHLDSTSDLPQDLLQCIFLLRALDTPLPMTPSWGSLVFITHIDDKATLVSIPLTNDTIHGDALSMIINMLAFRLIATRPVNQLHLSTVQLASPPSSFFFYFPQLLLVEKLGIGDLMVHDESTVTSRPNWFASSLVMKLCVLSSH